MTFQRVFHLEPDDDEEKQATATNSHSPQHHFTNINITSLALMQDTDNFLILPNRRVGRGDITRLRGHGWPSEFLRSLYCVVLCSAVLCCYAVLYYNVLRRVVLSSDIVDSTLHGPSEAGHGPLSTSIRRRHLQTTLGISLKGSTAGVAAVAGRPPVSREAGKEQWWEARPRPYFSDTPTNLTVISGQTAFLHCRVHMLGERSVTWMRARDLHILTVGFITYTADDRFQVLHSPHTDDWTLQVRSSQPRDAGTYTCQVNSDPKIVRNVYLSVTGDTARRRGCSSGAPLGLGRA
ncbi:hypothetical protein O3P69_020092 [Scylla paramamosain]|uniref:Ig-like domain-containing protein n=1 Tax=Scylla paramamosain TaxID=85552 RepID=A0AAW0TLJ6_SCYPA